MTLWAAREGDDNVKIQCTYGPVMFSVTEHRSHARSFLAQLGTLLEDAPEEKMPDEG